jgi:hypothetical protein
MLRPTSLRALILLPLAVAFVLAVPSVRALTPQETLNGILKTYAAEEGATTAAQLARTTITASADDLVAAVYEAIFDKSLSDQQVVDLAVAALLATNDATPKVRADKDKVAARIVEAAIVARNAQSDSALIGLLLPAVHNVNSSLAASKQLTAAGKEAVIAKALRATSNKKADGVTDSGVAAVIAAQSDAASASAAGTTPNAKRNTFTIAVLKLLTYKPQVYDPALATTSAATQATKGTLVQLNNGAPEPLVGEPLFNSNGVPPSLGAVNSVSEYIDALLDTYSPAVDKTTTAYTLAEGVATNPAVAGAVFGGLVKDLKTSGALANNTAILDLVRSTILSRVKLAPDIAEIVQNGFAQLAPGTDKATAAGQIVFQGGIKATNKGKFASGAIRSIDASETSVNKAAQTSGIITNVLSDSTTANENVTQAGLAAFAGAAAVGNGDPVSAAAINTTVIGKLLPKTTAAADLTAVQAIATAVIKGIAPANPDAARDVARSMFDIQRSIGTNPPANPYTTTAARQKLAADLAKGASTNYTAAGAAVGGVVQRSVELDSVTQDLDVTIASAAVKVASKAALSIAQKTSLYLNYSNTVGTSASTFATKLALTTTAATAADIAAGVALTDTSHAGDIVKAVITSNINNADVTVQGVTTTATQRSALKKAALTIANKAAIAVDVEAIGDIAQKVGTLFQATTNPGDKDLPKLSTLGTLATSLAKAINTKPQVSQSNRKDELGELAAVLVTASLNVPGGNTPAALAAIGTNIYKAASAKLLADVGNNAVDLKDIAGDVAGAIAQTIAHATTLLSSGTGGLTAAEKTALLTATGTGSLIKLLSTGAKTFAGQVNGTVGQSAFDLVRATEIGGGQYGYVSGSEAIGTNGTATPLLFSKFEIGYVVDAETRIKDL